MKHDIQILRRAIVSLSLLFVLALCGSALSAGAQESDASGQKTDAQAEAKPEAKGKERKADKQASPALPKVSRLGERDPFNKYRPAIRRPNIKAIPTLVAPPSIQARIARYKEEKRIAMNMQQPAPKPTTALLLGEMQVIGIFRTPRGYAAMVEATPIKLSYTIYPGERFFDGQLVAIEEDRLVFRRETKWSDGHVVRAVETKPLRQPNLVADPLAAAAKDSPANSSTGEAGKAEEKAASPEKH